MDCVTVYFADVEIVVDFFGVRGWNVVCCAPDFCGCCGWFKVRVLLFLKLFHYILRASNRLPGEEHTGSSSVSQNSRSITVTTRPGESGVPRWSVLYI